MHKPLNTKAIELYIGFWLGVVITALLFTYVLVNNFTSNHFLRQNNLFLDGKFYKLCERGKCK